MFFEENRQRSKLAKKQTTAFDFLCFSSVHPTRRGSAWHCEDRAHRVASPSATTIHFPRRLSRAERSRSLSISFLLSVLTQRSTWSHTASFPFNFEFFLVLFSWRKRKKNKRNRASAQEPVGWHKCLTATRTEAAAVSAYLGARRASTPFYSTPDAFRRRGNSPALDAFSFLALPSEKKLTSKNCPFGTGTHPFIFFLKNPPLVLTFFPHFPPRGVKAKVTRARREVHARARGKPPPSIPHSYPLPPPRSAKL